MSRLVSVAAVTCGLVIVPAIGSSADRTWIEVKGPHFTVVSDAPEKAAREALWTFEQFRAAIASMWPWAGVDGDRPMLLLLPKDDAALRNLTLPAAEQTRVPPRSMYIVGADRYFFLRLLDTPPDASHDSNPYQPLFRSYVDLAIRSGLQRELPYWLRVGLPLAISNSYVTDRQIEVARPMNYQLQRLRTQGRMPIDDLMAVESYAALGNDMARYSTFEATSWALVHYLLLGDNGAHREHFAKLLSLLLEGRTSSVAFGLAFGDSDKVTSSFAQYVTRTLLPSLRAEVNHSMTPGGFGVRALTLDEIAPIRGAFHASMRRTAEARAEVQAARTYETTAASFEVEGLLADADRQPAAALAAYSRAIELGSKNFYAYYRKASLTSINDPMVWSTRDRMLERAIELAPRYAPAYTMLADVKMQLGHGPEAIAAARRAVALQPSVAGYRLTLARFYDRAGQRADALRAARDALELARSDAERDAAQRAITSYARP